MKKSVLLCAILLIAAVSMGKSIKTLVVTVTPQMHCSGCENKIKGNLRFEKGIKKITTSIADQTVTVEYDAGKTTPEKIIKAFTKFGYEAKEASKCKTMKSAPCTKCKEK